MNGSYETQKYALDKIAMLGLFVVSLLIAGVIVVSRSAVVLSEPIVLNHTGLSVAMPAGNGWQSQKSWKFQENSFGLSSFFIPGSGRPVRLAHCQYLLSAAEDSPDTRFKQKASALDGVIVETGQSQTGILAIDWAHIKKPNRLLEVFLGTVRLPNNRQLDIEVSQAMGDSDEAEQVFRGITQGLRFEDNSLLWSGSAVIARIKRKGLTSLIDSRFTKKPKNNGPLDGSGGKIFFLITDSTKRPVGFTADVFTRSGAEAQLNVQAAIYNYIQGRRVREQAAFFQSDDRFEQFTWKSSSVGPVSSSGTELIVDETGIMTVRQPGLQLREKNYRLNPAAIPVVLLELAFSQLLEGGSEKVIVDIIGSDGTITPTLISRIRAEKTYDAEEQAVYNILQLEFLDGSGFSEQVYLDDQGWVLKKLVRRGSVFVLERTSLENIVRQFPERSEYILQNSEMLEQDGQR